LHFAQRQTLQRLRTDSGRRTDVLRVRLWAAKVVMRGTYPRPPEISEARPTAAGPSTLATLISIVVALFGTAAERDQFMVHSVPDPFPLVPGLKTMRAACHTLSLGTRQYTARIAPESTACPWSRTAVVRPGPARSRGSPKLI